MAVPLRESFGLVGKQLTERLGKRFRGLNLGVRGNTSKDSLNLLLNHPAADFAGIVVLMHNINDRLFLANGQPDESHIDQPAPTGWAAVSASVEKLWADFWDYVSYRSNLLFLVRRNAFGFNPWTGERGGEGTLSEDAINFQDPTFADSREAFRENLRSFVALSRAMKKQPVLMTQALGRHSEAQSAFNQTVREVAAELTVPLVDLAESVGAMGLDFFLSDDIHLNNTGSIAVADIITGSLAHQIFGAETQIVAESNPAGIPNLTICRPPDDPPAVERLPKRHWLIRRPGRYPVLSPNGRWLLYQTWTGTKEVIEILDMTSGTLSRIPGSQDSEEDRHATFFTIEDDQLGILFSRKFGAKERPHLSVVDGEAVRPLSLPSDVSASIPGTLGRVAFFAGTHTDRQTNPGPPDLYRWDRGHLTQLTNTPWEEWRPAPDPTGRYLYHIANPNGQFDIFRLDMESNATQRFIGSEADEWDPDVSPDGNWLVFASKRRGNWDISISPTGNPTSSVDLTSGPADDWDPRFTPDGRAVLFASTENEGPPHMFIVCLFGESAIAN